MKQHLSRTLRGVAFLYFSFPLTFVILCAILFDIASEEWVLVFLSPTFYLVSFLALVTGFGLKEMRRWAWYVLLITNGAILYHTADLAASYGDSHNKLLAFLLFVLGAFVLTYRVAKEIRVPYFFPRIKWWESDPRFKVSIPTVIIRRATIENRSEESDFQPPHQAEGEILDLSLGGCFVKTREEFHNQEIVRVFFQAFGTACEARGMVVWTTESTVTRPKGVGIKFTKPSSLVKRSIKQITHSIGQLNKLQKSNLSDEDRLRLLAKIDELRSPVGHLPSLNEEFTDTESTSKQSSKKKRRLPNLKTRFKRKK